VVRASRRWLFLPVVECVGRSSSCPAQRPGESSTAPACLQSGAVPELPDLTVVSEAFQAALAGRSIARVEAPGPLAVRGPPAELEALVGQRLERVRRRGKFLLLDLSTDAIVVNPMLTGRFQLAAPSVKWPTKTAFVLAFGPRVDGPPADAALWTTDAGWLPANDAPVEVR